VEIKNKISRDFARLLLMKNEVVLVNEKDEVLGTAEKLAAHQNGGQLHRAFSLFIFNSQGEMLLQKRASCKYHCPDLWTNACCSHPNLERSIEESAKIRLKEEMGMSCGEISREFSFIYRQEFDNGLTEYELDHVLTAISDELPSLNLEEVGEFKYIKISDLYEELAENPAAPRKAVAKFTIWFKIIFADERFKEVLDKFLK